MVFCLSVSPATGWWAVQRIPCLSPYVSLNTLLLQQNSLTDRTCPSFCYTQWRILASLGNRACLSPSYVIPPVQPVVEVNTQILLQHTHTPIPIFVLKLTTISLLLFTFCTVLLDITDIQPLQNHQSSSVGVVVTHERIMKWTGVVQQTLWSKLHRGPTQLSELFADLCNF